MNNFDPKPNLNKCSQCGRVTTGPLCHECRVGKGKTNHLQIESLIQQAIKACSYDSTLSETKSYLVAASNAVEKVSKKRSRRIANAKANELARTKQQEWWEMLKKNASENLDLGWIDDE